jgi:hypothetical protein
MILMMNGKKTFPGFLVLCISFALSSCTNFFSTSLAPWAKRDPSKIIPAVNTGNVKELISQAESDPDLSLAVLKGIQDAIGNTANEDEKAALRNAALQAATNASGLGNALFANAGKIINTMDDPDELKNAAINAVHDMSNLNEVSNILLGGIIPPVSDQAGFSNFLNVASATDLALSATVVLLGEAQRLDSPEAVEGYITGAGSGRHFDFDNPVSPAEEIAVELAKETIAIVDDPLRGDASGELKEILENLGFKSGAALP